MRLSRVRRFQRWSQHVRGRPVAHFLHVGKTAGTALKSALRPLQDRGDFYVMFHSHHVRLMDIPKEDYFFFSVRDPISRFASGFRSRQRQGRPAYSQPWEPAEAVAFANFESPDALASALSAGGADQERAEEAMRAIMHVRQSYWDWFGDEAYLRSRADHLLWIGRQEALDLGSLSAALGLPDLQLPSDPAKAHRSPDGPGDALSEVALENLRRWYRADFEFLELCDELCPRKPD